MPDKSPPPPAPIEVPAGTPPVRRHPGHRGADVRDTVAEMTAKAHEISLEAGSKMAAAMKEVINAAAGLTAFAIESARDLVQYMVRRGQMTQDEADKLIREAEDAWARKHKGKPAVSVKAPDAAKSKSAAHHKPAHHKPAHHKAASHKPAAHAKPAAKKHAAKAKPAAKAKAAAKKPTPKK